MEDTMSSYSFSHQFYQRWTRAPETVRSAIVQELTDITTLLQTQTPFEEFVFTTHDLDAHLDELYDTYASEQASAQKIAEKQAQQRAEAEQQRLAEEKLAAQKETDEKRKLAQEKLAQEKQQEEEQEEQKQKEAKESSTESLPNNEPQSTIIKPKKGAAIDLSPTDPKLSAAHADLISELEMHIDDYLTEQMMQISEDLKSWLRAEMGRQLIEIAKKEEPTEKTAKK